MMISNLTSSLGWSFSECLDQHNNLHKMSCFFIKITVLLYGRMEELPPGHGVTSGVSRHCWMCQCLSAFAPQNHMLCLSIWMCGSKSTPCWAALPGLILVLNFLATSNPVVFSNVTNPALQQVFSSACKVALGYKALYRCLLLMLQSKQIKKKKQMTTHTKKNTAKKNTPQWWLL